MPCEHNFGIIKNFDAKKDYANLDEFGSFPDVFPNALQAYECVNIDDDAINDWWPHIEGMKSYFNIYSCPETALARYGITLIPPDSLDLFYILPRRTPMQDLRSKCRGFCWLYPKQKEIINL